MEIIVRKSYDHINRAFSRWDTPVGRRIRNKDEYDRAMKEEGMISYEEAQERATKNKEGRAYNLSDEAKEIIRETKGMASKDGRIKLTDKPKLIEKMISHGSIKNPADYSRYLPEHYKNSGGFKTA